MESFDRCAEEPAVAPYFSSSAARKRDTKTGKVSCIEPCALLESSGVWHRM